MTMTITLLRTTMYLQDITLRLLLLISMLLISGMALAQPANDNCSTATELIPGTTCNYGDYTLIGATLSAVPHSSCANNPKREVWFKTSVPPSGILVLQATTDVNPIIAITLYTGTCGTLTTYDCTNALVPGTGYLSLTVEDVALAGTDIYIEVTRGNSNTAGNFKLCAFVTDRPVNENCNDAILLTNEKGSFEHTEYSNRYGVSGGQAPPTCGTFSGADVWFKTVMPVTGRLVVHAQSDEINPVVALYTGGCNSMVYQTCATAVSKKTEIIFNDIALAEETIFIRVYADGNGTGGSFELLVLEPTQDICAEARYIDGGTAQEEYTRYTNKYATTSTDGANPTCGAYKGTDIWFTMDVPASGELIINSKASSDFAIKPVLTIYSGNCSSLTQVACNNFGSANSFAGKVSIIPADNLANQTIYLRMHNYNSAVGGAFDLSARNPSAALPVELVRFTANTFNSEVILDWTTATEDNNDYFLVEHSIDGVHFIPIDKVAGNGTTSDMQHYSYVHTNPYYGENYYRLKQVDLDGAFEYFNVVVATIRLTEEQFKLFPNPGFTKDVITIRWSEDLGKDKLNLSVTDALGRLVYQQVLENQYARESTINCASINMDAGIYFLQLSNERQVIAHRRFNLVGD